jgi:hypothetical protein
MQKQTLFLFLFIILSAFGCNRNQQKPETRQDQATSTVHEKQINQPSETTAKRIEFSDFNSIFKFSGEINKSYEIEYVPELSAINIYDPQALGNTKREQSQIFIRFFQAKSFQTLNSVEVLSQKTFQVGTHDAIRYQIQKRKGVADFPLQPLWRNQKHEVTDIRYSKTQNIFYVFAKNPELSEITFNLFIDRLLFHNDQTTLTWPIENAKQRITKKAFGLRVSPGDSPISPERFSGYHTAVDFEILSGEEDATVAVYTICGGPIKTKRAASGYGGLVVQSCLINDSPVTINYGHVKLSSITATVGQYLAPGATLGVLGEGYSKETDGERKHLHLGIHKGSVLDLSGYVPNENALKDWIDITTLIK